MSLQDDEFLARLLQTFSEEAADHIQTIITGILVMEKDSSLVQSEEVEPVYRACHSLKGAARAVGLRDIETVCQNLETVFSAVRKNELILQSAEFDLIHQVIGALEGILSGDRNVTATSLINKIKTIIPSAGVSKIQEGKKIPFSPTKSNIESNSFGSEKKEDQSHRVKTESSSSPQSPPAPVSTSIRISDERLKSLYITADDLLSYRLSSATRLVDLRGISQKLQTWRWSLNRVEGDISHLKRMKAENQDSLNRVLTFIDNTRDIIGHCEVELGIGIRAMTQDQYEMDSVISGLIESIKEVVLVPFSSLTDTYPRMVRDIAREQNKEVQFSMSGTDVEIDRRILDVLRDPLIHLLRNAVDHGIEPSEIRMKKNKNPNGTLSVHIDHARANQVIIRITDDGYGIDPTAISAAAIKNGIIKEEELAGFSDEEKVRLIFTSGLSTSKSVSSVSGRGLGLAIVQEMLHKVGGYVHVSSIPNQGTTFTLTAPITLATFWGILVYSENRPFFLPLKQVERVLNPEKSEISTIEGRIFYCNGEDMIPAGFLGSILGLSAKTGSEEAHSLVIIKSFGKKIALFVQKVGGSQEIVVRDMGLQLKEVRFISGVTILNNALVVPVLHIEDIVSAMQVMNKPYVSSDEISGSLAERKKIMVAEDSITSRMLLKNILEGAGFDVETAVDGLDAFTRLKINPVDLVVSDVDMPRMNGFVLTEKIRSEKKLSELPVILVTSLDSREDREHGIQVGANAYIIKSTFDQGNLLEVIKKLIVTG